VEEDGRVVLRDLSDRVLERVAELGLDCLMVVGGDGSLRIGRDLARKGLHVIGIPKTIDNDLSATDVTFGYNTALTTATDALDKLHTTAESHHRIMVLEVMGRYAGWIALEAGIAGGADVILIPEIPYRLEALCQTVEKRRKHGRMFSIFVVAEGATQEGGEMIFEEDPATVAGKEPKLGGIGAVVARQVSEAVGCESRVTVLGHLQRGGSPTVFDRLLGSRFGLEAVRCAHRGEFGRMVALQGQAVVSVDLEEAVEKLKRVNPNGTMATAAEDLGISLGR
jgi:6-phosphofructokinase 1